MSFVWIALAAIAAGALGHLVGGKLATNRARAELAAVREELARQGAELAHQQSEQDRALVARDEEAAGLRAELAGRDRRIQQLEEADQEERRWAEQQFRATLDDFRALWQASGLPLTFHEMPKEKLGEPTRTQLAGLANRLTAWVDRYGFGNSELAQQLGLWAAAQRDLKGAVELFQEAAHKGMGIAAWLAMGDCLWELDRQDRARVAYANCLDFEATPPHVFERYAKVAIERRDYREGVAALEKLLARPDNPVEVFAQLSYAYGKLKLDDKAVQIAEKGLKKHPKSGELHAKVIIPLWRLGKKDKAEKHYKEALELDPKGAEAPFSLGVANLHAGDLKTATQLLREALELNKRYPEAYYCLGVIHNRQQQWKRALQYFQKAVELKPDYAEAYYNMKDAHEGLKDFDAAVAALKKATTLNPDYR
jgi:tetratricopeptide (TPR) repeat protein